jgi:hypothetical protein
LSFRAYNKINKPRELPISLKIILFQL